jgi:hypothetical protein
MNLVFRDHPLSDLSGSSIPECRRRCANHLLNNIRDAATQCWNAGAMRWCRSFRRRKCPEYYPQSVASSAPLHDGLRRDPLIEPVTISEAVAPLESNYNRLERVPGSWINAFNVCGAPE